MKFSGNLRICEVYAGTARSVEPFRKSGAEVALLVDANPLAAATYIANHSSARYMNADLMSAAPADVNGWAGGRIDVLLGCPPCQGFSENGTRDADDPRNAHVTKFSAIALAARPRAVVMENVPVAAASKHFADLCAALEHAGYVWTAMIANAAQYGSCQTRQRLLFVAVDRNAGSVPVFEAPTHGSGQTYGYATRAMRPVADDVVEALGISPATQRLAKTLPQDFSTTLGSKPLRHVGRALSHLPQEMTPAAHALSHVPRVHTGPVLERMSNVPEGGRAQVDRFFSQSYGRLHRKGLARTITTFFWHPGAGRFWHATEQRALTLREAARVQGFADDFWFPGHSRKACAMVGNALDKALADLCYRTVRAALT